MCSEKFEIVLICIRGSGHLIYETSLGVHHLIKLLGIRCLLVVGVYAPWCNAQGLEVFFETPADEPNRQAEKADHNCEAKDILSPGFEGEQVVGGEFVHRALRYHNGLSAVRVECSAS